MRPRTVVPTEGRRGPEGRVMDVVGVFCGLFCDGDVWMGPAMLAMRLEFETCVPGPTVLVEEGPRICPGKADMVIRLCFGDLNSMSISSVADFVA